MSDFVADYFKIENTSDHTLSIQLSLNGFSFCINLANNNSVVAFKNMPLTISSPTLLARRFKDWYYSESILQKHFQKTRLFVFSNKYTLVPLRYHQSDLNEELTYLLFKDGEQLKMAENLVDSLNAKLLFALPDDFLLAIQETLGECDILHPVKLLIEAANKSQVSSSLTVLFNEKELHVLVAKDKQIRLSNVYTINHSNDVIYYLLNAAKQLGIDGKQTTILCGGRSVFADESIKMLSNYFDEVIEIPAMIDSIGEQLGKQKVRENIALFL